MEERLGTVRISPEVLGTIASLTALSVTGVVGMSGDLPNGMGRLLRRHVPPRGVKILIKDEAVHVDIHIIVTANANMLQTAQEVQREVTKAIDTMVGMPVREVNVYIQDVV